MEGRHLHFGIILKERPAAEDTAPLGIENMTTHRSLHAHQRIK